MLEKENSELKLQLKDMKAHHNELQGDNHESRLQSEVKQKQLENPKFRSEKVQAHEEISKLKAQLKSLRKVTCDVDKMKVQANILQEENSDLKSQLEVAQTQLELLEKKQYGRLKNEEGCSIALQKDTVCALCSKK